MNTVELLMNADVESFGGRPKAQMEINRLTKKFGQPFVVELQGLSSKKYTELSSRMMDNNNKLDASKVSDTYTLIVMESMTEPNLKDADLQAHFGVKTPKDLAQKIFNGGEIVALADKVAILSGYGDDVISEVKN